MARAGREARIWGCSGWPPAPRRLPRRTFQKMQKFRVKDVRRLELWAVPDILDELELRARDRLGDVFGLRGISWGVLGAADHQRARRDVLPVIHHRLG